MVQNGWNKNVKNADMGRTQEPGVNMDVTSRYFSLRSSGYPAALKPPGREADHPRLLSVEVTSMPPQVALALNAARERPLEKSITRLE
jgi:hypothetical protein